MKWVVIVEAALTFLMFAGGIFSQSTAKSADEGIIAAPLYLGGAGMIVITLLTLFAWWGWTVTFRG